MSKPARKGEHVQAGKSQSTEMVLADRPETTVAPELSGAAPVAEGQTEPTPLGMYWFVIILWTAAFLTMIAFEIVSAVFKR